VLAEDSDEHGITRYLIKRVDKAMETVKEYRLTHGTNEDKLEVNNSLQKQESATATVVEEEKKDEPVVTKIATAVAEEATSVKKEPEKQGILKSFFMGIFKKKNEPTQAAAAKH